MLTPVLALVCWTLIVWIWMYATRIPAMQKANIDPQSAIHPGSLSGLPQAARVVADNYNHLHEQPTIFYALALYAHLAGAGDAINIGLAWAYVGVRIVHSLVQIIVRRVTLRFSVFATGSVILMAIAVRCVLAL
ncbi:MAG: MAPEG family protein [Parvularculaceae bacterium]|nr:MAPEG family protein [Parvularculaceae bacterium]